VTLTTIPHGERQPHHWLRISTPSTQSKSTSQGSCWADLTSSRIPALIFVTPLIRVEPELRTAMKGPANRRRVDRGMQYIRRVQSNLKTTSEAPPFCHSRQNFDKRQLPAGHNLASVLPSSWTKSPADPMLLPCRRASLTASTETPSTDSLCTSAPSEQRK